MDTSIEVWFWVILVITWIPVGYLWVALLRLVHFFDWVQKWSYPADEYSEPDWFFCISNGWLAIIFTGVAALLALFIMGITGFVIILKKVGLVSKDYQFK